jgi:hypothetical protein
LLLLTGLALSGCWTAPRADVSPPGPARLLQNGIVVEAVKDPMVVRSVDGATRRIVASSPKNGTTDTLQVDPTVSGLKRIKAGDTVQLTVAEELTIYVPPQEQRGPPADAPPITTPEARVLSVDPSYRLLTLQFPDGRKETLKVSTSVKLETVQSGDAVAIRPLRVIALQVLKHQARARVN